MVYAGTAEVRKTLTYEIVPLDIIQEQIKRAAELGVLVEAVISPTGATYYRYDARITIRLHGVLQDAKQEIREESG